MKETIKAQAKKLTALLAAQQGPVLYQDALELLAQLNGYRNWKTFSGVLDQASVPGSPTGRLNRSAPEWQHLPICDGATTGRYSSKESNMCNTPSALADADYASLELRAIGLLPERRKLHVPGEMPYAQDELPGVGYVYSVPISVDTSMTARVLVRAANRQDAIDLARTLVAEGKAPLELDEGNYRGRADYYCSDDSDDGVYRTQEPAERVSSEVDDGVQVGHYLVQTYLDEEDATQVWADLTVFDSLDVEDGAPAPVSGLTSMACSLSRPELQAFCRLIATRLCDEFPDPAAADRKEVHSRFAALIQGA